MEGITITIKPSTQYENGQDLGHWPVLEIAATELPSGKSIGNIRNIRIGNTKYESASAALEAAQTHLNGDPEGSSISPLAEALGN